MADWRSIHSQVCHLIASLKPPETHANSDTERKQRKKHQQQTRVGIYSLVCNCAFICHRTV